ncbi:hypothetical protein HN011_000532 [Eciton burchellii]|nr:hypothetical protein HN011_000532 [Eciton burchellii]
MTETPRLAWRTKIKNKGERRGSTMAADFDNRPTDSRKRARQRTAISSDTARSALFGTATLWRENNATGEKDA